MHHTLFLPAALQLTATVLLAIAPFASATPSQSGLHSRDVGLPKGWVAVGCYTDSASKPTLTSLLYTDADLNMMTVGWCTNYCNDNKKALAGLEDGQYCYCGNIRTPGSMTLPFDNCMSECAGDRKEYCGGTDSLSLYWNNTKLQPQPTMTQYCRSLTDVVRFSNRDSNDARTLNNQMKLTGPEQWSNSAEYCIQNCKSAGYSAAGMEFGVECWCDHSILYDRQPIDPMSCMLACPGNSFEICGGPNAITIYADLR